ncbi:MAG: n-acetylglutamate synthase [Fluviicola sp.]
MNYHNKKFRPVSNTENGETSEETLFQYHQEGNLLTCSYSGGQIISGQLIGLVDESGNIDMRYHQVNRKGELMTGVCQSKPEILPDGRIRLHESWQWTSGDCSKGNSVLEEVD